MGVNLKSLIGKLNHNARGAGGRRGLCLARTHYDVEFEHYLTKLLEGPTAISRAYCGISRWTRRG